MRIFRRERRPAYPADLTLKVLQHHIDGGTIQSQTKCAVSQAFRDVFPDAEPWTHHDGIYIWARTRRGLLRCVAMYVPRGPDHENFTRGTDAGESPGPVILEYRRNNAGS